MNRPHRLHPVKVEEAPLEYMQISEVWMHRFKRLRRQRSYLSHIQSFMRTLVSSLLRVLSFTVNLGLERHCLPRWAFQVQDALLRIQGFCYFRLLLPPMHEVQSKSKNLGLEFGAGSGKFHIGNIFAGGWKWTNTKVFGGWSQVGARALLCCSWAFPIPLSLLTKLMPLGQRGRFSFYIIAKNTPVLPPQVHFW
jgi:hypothetical protein